MRRCPRRSDGAGLALALTLILLILPLGACTSSRPGAEAPVDVASAPRGALVTVTNGHVQDVRVYVVRDGLQYALGSLTTGQRRSFGVPSSILGHGGRIRLRVDLLGDARTFTSTWIPATTGDHVEWSVGPRLSLSHFTVRPLHRRNDG